MACSTFLFSACEEEERSAVFDEKNIVLSFSAMSDVHQEVGNQAVSDKLANALNYAQELNGKPLDLVVFAGDITDNTHKTSLAEGYEETYNKTYNADLQMFKETMECSIDLSKTDVFYALGNHDYAPDHIDWTPSAFKNQLGAEFFKADAEDSQIDKGRRHAVVNGYHFLAVQPDLYWRTDGYPDETVAWLDNQLKTITKENPNQYVFVVAHPPLYDTVFSSQMYDWSDREVQDVIKNYPQTLYFSGHIHNPLQDETQIFQNENYTAVDCGSVKYGAPNTVSRYYSNKEFSNSVDPYGTEFSQGLLVQVDKSGNVRITRCNYQRRTTIKTPWEISYPTADKTHLAKYDNQTRKKENVAPTFAQGASATAEKTGGVLTLTWDSATDDDMIRYYRIEIYEEADSQKKHAIIYNVATMTYQYDKVSDMPTSMQFSQATELAGEYIFEFTPVDVWDKEGTPILIKASI